MLVSAKQLNLCDISTDFDKFYNQNQDDLLSLLNESIDISDFIPFSFYQKYYSHFGTKRNFTLEAMLNSFILKNILSISIVDLLISILHISSEVRSFCGFLKIPNKSQFSRFKTDFLDNLDDLFNNLVDVTENNPKFYQSELYKSKAYAKWLAKDNPNSSFDVEKYAQGQMPKFVSSNPDAKLTYLNGHFGYYQKYIISTNALGVIRNVNINGRAQYVLSCENPCSPSKCGRIKNITIHYNYRFNTSMPRDSVK